MTARSPAGGKTKGGAEVSGVPARRVLVAGLPAPVKRSLEDALAAEGYVVASAGDGAQHFGTIAGTLRPDVVLLSAAPDRIRLCEEIREIRETDARAVVIVLGRRGYSEDGAVAALDAGADDFVREPMRPREFVARIRANLRGRASGLREVGVLEFGDLRVDTGSGEVWVKGEPVPLRHMEFRLLVALVSRAGRLLANQQLLREVWARSSRDIKSRTLSVHVAHLRAAIEDPSDYTYIQTVIKFGYRFVPLPKESVVQKKGQAAVQFPLRG